MNKMETFNSTLVDVLECPFVSFEEAIPSFRIVSVSVFDECLNSHYLIHNLNFKFHGDSIYTRLTFFPSSFFSFISSHSTIFQLFPLQVSTFLFPFQHLSFG